MDDTKNCLKPAVNLDEVRQSLENTIEKLRKLEIPYDKFLTSYKDERMLEHIRDLKGEACGQIRTGDLYRANQLNIEAYKYSLKHFDMYDMTWCWFRVMLLAKNFSDARLLLKLRFLMHDYVPYFDYLAGLDNIKLLKSQGFAIDTIDMQWVEVDAPSPAMQRIIDDYANTGKFDSHNYLLLTWPQHYIHGLDLDNKKQVERQIARASRWSSFTLSEGDFSQFLKYLG